MQPIAPLTIDDFKDKSKKTISKIEIFIDPDWINLCNLGGKNYLKQAHYSTGQWKPTHEPIAADFNVTIDDTTGDFNPQNAEGAYKDYLKRGRKTRIWTGFKKAGVDYLWQWIIGVISEVEIDRSNKQIAFRGFDFTQYLCDVELRSPNNYWGESVTKSTVKDQAEYDMPEGCNGCYIAYLNGIQIYDQYDWLYDPWTNKFFFLPSKIPTENGEDNLIIYYYVDELVENMVADILAKAAKLYPDRAVALADMDYEPTGVVIKRPRFNAGVKALYGIQKLCERVDYEFFFKYNGQPLFRPILVLGG